MEFKDLSFGQKVEEVLCGVLFIAFVIGVCFI